MGILVTREKMGMDIHCFRKKWAQRGERECSEHFYHTTKLSHMAVSQNWPKIRGEKNILPTNNAALLQPHK